MRSEKSINDGSVACDPNHVIDISCTVVYCGSPLSALHENTSAMANNTFGAALSKRTCAPKSLEDFKGRPTSSVYLSEKGVVACPGVQPLQKDHVDMKCCVGIIEAPLRRFKDIESNEIQKFDLSLCARSQYLRKTSKSPCSERKTGTAVDPLGDTRSGVKRTKVDRLPEKGPSRDETGIRDLDGDAENVKGNRTERKLLLLPARTLFKGRTLQASETAAFVEGGETRVSIDSLCSPTAFSVAATAASLTCSSPPSCTSPRESHAADKLGAECEAAHKSDEDVERQALTLCSPQPRRVTSLTCETRVHAGGRLHRAKSYDGGSQQVQRQHNEHAEGVKRDELQIERSHTGNDCMEPREEKHETLYSCSEPLPLQETSRASTQERNADEIERRDVMSSHCAAVRDHSNGTDGTNESSPRERLVETVTGGVLTAAERRAPSFSRNSSDPFVEENAERMPSFRSSIACGEDETNAPAAATEEEKTTRKRTEMHRVGCRSSVASTENSRGSTLPCGDNADLPEPRCGQTSTDAYLRCSSLNPPTCSFCSSVHEIAFPPPPARLVARFIAYVFEPQLQGLQRRLHANMHEGSRRKLLFGGEIANRKLSMASTTPLEPCPSCSMPENSPAADTRAATLPGKACGTEAPSRSGSSFPLCPLQRQEPKTNNSANMSEVWGGRSGSRESDEQGAQDTCESSSSGAKSAESRNTRVRQTVTPCASSSPTTVPAELSTFSYASSSVVRSATITGASIRSEADTETPLLKHSQSALLALQLKQHLLSLLAYMEKLPKRSRMGHAGSCGGSMFQADQPPTHGEVVTRSLVDSWQCKPPSGAGAVLQSSNNVLHHRGHFAFHVEQLLRAEIRVRPVSLLTSQVESAQVTANPSVLPGDGTLAHSSAGVQGTFTGDSPPTGDTNTDETRGSDASTRETMSHDAIRKKNMAFLSSANASEHMVESTPEVDVSHRRATQAVEAESVRVGGDISRSENGLHPHKGEDEDESNICVNGIKDNEEMSTTETQLLVRQHSRKMAKASPLSSNARLGVTLTDELLPRTAEDAVLLGAPPSIVNYLIVLSPLLVLQALQQLGDAAASENLTGSGCDALTHDRRAGSHSTHMQDLPTERRSTVHRSEKADGHRGRMPLTATEQAILSQSSSPPMKHATPSPAGVKRATGAENPCATTGASRQVRRNGTEKEEHEGGRVEEEPICAPQLAVVDAVATTTTCHEYPSVGSKITSTAVLGQVQAATVPTESEATATNSACYAPAQHADKSGGATFDVLQAELKSALCWADRGLVALFCASSPYHAASLLSGSNPVHPPNDRLQDRGPTTKQLDALDTYQQVSEEVTAESLTAALLLLAKAIKHSQSGRPTEAQFRAPSRSTCERCMENVLCIRGRQRVSSPQAQCYCVQHACMIYNSMSTTALCQAGPQAHFSLSTVKQPLQLHHQSSQEDLRTSTLPQRSKKALKDEESRTQVEETKAQSERAISLARLATPPTGDEPEAEEEALESFQLHANVSPLRPTASAHDMWDTAAGEEGADPFCVSAKEREAAIFFAPLHYPHERCSPYLFQQDRKAYFETRLESESLPADATVAQRGTLYRKRETALLSPTEDDVRPIAEAAEKTSEDDLLERLALEILAQVDNTAFPHEADADAEWQEGSREPFQANKGGKAPSCSHPTSSSVRQCRHTDFGVTGSWLHQPAQLLTERRGENRDISEKTYLCAGGGEKITFLSEDEYAFAPTSCPSLNIREYDKHMWRQTNFTSDAGARMCRSSSMRMNETDREGFREETHFPQRDSQRRKYCGDRDLPLPACRGEEKVSAPVNCSESKESSRFFDASRTLQVEDESGAQPDFNRPCSFKQPPLSQDPAMPHAEWPRAFSRYASSGKNFHTTEGGGGTLVDAPRHARSPGAEDAYLYVAPSESLDGMSHNASREGGCPLSGRREALGPVHEDESNFAGIKAADGQHQPDVYERLCDLGETGRARVLLPDIVDKENAPQGTEQPESQLQPQRRGIEQLLIGRRSGEVWKNLPSAACSRVSSSSLKSPSPCEGFDRREARADQHRAVTKAVNCTLVNGQDSDSNKADSDNLRWTRTRAPRRKSSAADPQNLKDDVSQKRLPWKAATTRRQQRSTQAADAAEATVKDNHEEERVYRAKRLMPCTEDDTSAQGEQSGEGRRCSLRRRGTTVAAIPLDEKEGRLKGGTTARAPSEICADSEDRGYLGQEEDLGALLERLGDADETDVELDTRRPMRGVYFDRTQRSWIGSFYEDRRQIKKRFKIDTYGFVKAKELAVDVRLGYERRMLNGVVGASGCAAPSEAEVTSRHKRPAPAQKDNASSDNMGTEAREAEMPSAGCGTDHWTKNAILLSPEIPLQLSSLASLQRKGSTNSNPTNNCRSSPGVMEDEGTQVDSEICDTPATQSARPADCGGVAVGLACMSKLSTYKSVSDYGVVCDVSVARIKSDSVVGKERENGTARRACVPDAVASHINFSSGCLTDSFVRSANAQPSYFRRLPQHEPQENVKDGAERLSSPDVPHTAEKWAGLPPHAAHDDAGPQKTCARELSAVWNKEEIFEPLVRDVDPSQRKNTYLSSTGTATTSSRKAKLDTPLETEERERQTAHEIVFNDGNSADAAECVHSREDERSRPEMKKQEDWGQVEPHQAEPGGNHHAARREVGQHKMSMQSAYSHKHLCEKKLSVSCRSGTQQPVEDPPAGVTLQTAASRRAAKGTDDSGKYLHESANLTEEYTSNSWAHPCVRRNGGTKTVAGTTRDKKAYLPDRVDGRPVPSCIKVDHIIQDHGIRKAFGKEGTCGRTIEQEKRSSTSFAPSSAASSLTLETVCVEGQPQGARGKTESAPHLWREKAPPLGSPKATAGASERHADGSRFSLRALESEPPSVRTSSNRSDSCSRFDTNGYPITRPSTRRPEAAAAAYMCSKRKNRSVDTLPEGARCAAPLFVHDLPLGVFYTSKKHAYCANWYEGKRQLKRYFPIFKFGEPEARRLAIAARRDAERRERETRCRTGGSSSAHTSTAEKEGILNSAHAERHVPPAPLTEVEALPGAANPDPPSNDIYAGQTDQPLAKP